MLVELNRTDEASRLNLADFEDTPLAVGLPPYPKAMIVRLLADRLDMGVKRGDGLLVDRDGSIVAVLRDVQAVRSHTKGRPRFEVVS